MKKTNIECDFGSDVVSLTVGNASPNPAASNRVTLAVNDADTADEGRPLTTAQLLPSQAIKVARALLEAAGVRGLRDGNRCAYIFID